MYHASGTGRQGQAVEGRDFMGMLMMAMWQDADALSGENSRLLMVFIGLVAAALVIQAIVVVVAAIGAMRMQKKVSAIADEISMVGLPFLREANGLFMKSQVLLDEITPALRIISENVTLATDNLAVASQVVRAKAQEFDATLTDVNLRTRSQVRRVDGMVTAALMATSGIAASIHYAIQVPVREVAGIISGLKAGLDSLVGRARDFGAFSGREKPTNYSDL